MTRPRGRLSRFEREIISLAPVSWIPFHGPSPYRCRVTGLTLTVGASLAQTPLANGRTATTGGSTDVGTTTYTTLNGVTAMTLLAWVWRPLGTWADGKCALQFEWFAATGRGMGFDGRTTNTSLEVVKTSSGSAFFPRTGTVSTPQNKWVLIAATTDLNTTTAPVGYIDGVDMSASGANNGYTAGSMDSSVTYSAGAINSCQMRDLVMLNQLLSASDVARLAQHQPTR